MGWLCYTIYIYSIMCVIVLDMGAVNTVDI